MADASSPMLSATVSVKTATRGQPNAISAGPPIVSPCPYSVTAPVKIEIIENDMAKFEKPPIERNSSWAYPSAPSSCSSAEDSILVVPIITAQDVIKTGAECPTGFFAYPLSRLLPHRGSVNAARLNPVITTVRFDGPASLLSRPNSRE